MSEFFAQSEFGARRGLRNTPRDSQHQSDLAAKRGTRSKLTKNYNCENSYAATGCHDTKGRRSPRVSSARTFGGARTGLSDITNVTAGRASQADKFNAFKPLQQQPSFQPPKREVPLPPPAAAAVDMLTTAFRAVSLEDKVLSDPQSVQEYVPDIIDKYFSGETRSPPSKDYMEMQTDITSKMRMILIDWLMEVHSKYRLRPETLHLTVNLVDRYLSKKQVDRKRLQLIGVVAMFIATKFEEINPPELPDWVYITDKAYTKEDVLLMECNMLSTLSFQIVVPTAAHFFDHLAVANGCDSRHRSCAQYLLELGLLDIRMLQYKPSHMVAAALLLSNEISRRSIPWSETMVHQARQSEQALRHCAEELRELWKADRAGAGGQLQAVHKKFSSAQQHFVATANF